MWERFNDYPGIPSNMTSTHPMQTLGRSTYQNVGTYEYHMLSSVNMFKYNGEKWFIPSPSHPPKLNYTHFTGNMFYDFTMCLAGHGFERWCSTWSAISTITLSHRHRIPCYMINVSIQFNTFQVRIQGLARDACIEHVHVMLGGYGSKTIIEISAVSHAEGWEWQIRQSALHQDIPSGYVKIATENGHL